MSPQQSGILCLCQRCSVRCPRAPFSVHQMALLFYYSARDTTLPFGGRCSCVFCQSRPCDKLFRSRILLILHPPRFSFSLPADSNSSTTSPCRVCAKHFYRLHSMYPTCFVPDDCRQNRTNRTGLRSV